MNLIKLSLIFPLLFLMACSAAYEKVKKIDSGTPNTFHQYLLSNYQQNASFEAEEMHDWNSAKLYSEKALRAMSGENIYPEKITYWKIPEDKLKEIRIGYDNLTSIYEEAIIKDPQNLAKAISSLDCWAEQEEEKWQTWDIAKCKDDFVKAMHEIYNNLLTEKKDLDQNIFVKVRSTGSLLEAKVDLKDNNTANVHLLNPEDGISPGQACVFYSKDQYGHRVLGGGWTVSYTHLTLPTNREV